MLKKPRQIFPEIHAIKFDRQATTNSQNCVIEDKARKT